MLLIQQRLVLAALSLAAVHATDSSTNPYGPDGICIVHSVEVVNELLDSSVYIWAASKRCGEHGPYQCEIDVASAVEAITKAITVMIQALTECGQLSHTGCGVAVGNLVSSLAGISAATGEILESCPPQPPPKPSAYDGMIPIEGNSEGVPILETALCVVDIKDSLRSIFHAARAFMTVKESCKKGGEECATNSLRIVAALAGLGGYLAGAVGHCTPMPPHPVPQCAKGILMLTRHMSDVAEFGIEIKDECSSSNSSSKSIALKPNGTYGGLSSLPTSPLYDEEYDNEDDWQKGKVESFSSSKVSSLNFALVAFLPITAFASFAVGWSRHRSRPVYENLREINVA